MDRYLTGATLIRFNRWLISLQKRRIPQAFVALSGLGSIGLGLIFLGLPDRIEAAPSLNYLTNAIPTKSWVAIFLVIGAVMVALAIARYHWSAPISAVFCLVMFVFCAFTIVDVVEGPATGLVVLLSGLFGGLNLLSGVMAVAPINESVYQHTVHPIHGDQNGDAA